MQKGSCRSSGAGGRLLGQESGARVTPGGGRSQREEPQGGGRSPGQGDSSLQAENRRLRGVAQHLQGAVSKPQARLSARRRAETAHPPTHRASPSDPARRQDDAISLFGSEEDEDEAAALVAKRGPAGGLPGRHPVRLADLGGWGVSSKLVPVGYGIPKLQIQCVQEDKVGTDLLEEEITKFQGHVQSVDIAAFNKI
ncbi:unnamed protein product [Nyctereutes procyonoides]|uniref:Elongation factor 1-delta n=1 Tax=Nyctereutes procyonoides TaxID=34880 RepID=A0A811Y7A0_NYCPR|nr:unnamed protein product [Nyctereutes procyonoides]